jgi:hypothetical protein
MPPTVLDPTVWGPPFWFFLHTVCLTYPHHPNAITKKKYYDLMQNLPVFLPNDRFGNDFLQLLETYPVSAYLDNRDSLVKWIHFIHNKVNAKLEKPTISLNEFYYRYYEAYKPKDIQLRETYRWREKILYTVIVLAVVSISAYLYHK